jgi:hypothetical protein
MWLYHLSILCLHMYFIGTVLSNNINNKLYKHKHEMFSEIREKFHWCIIICVEGKTLYRAMFPLVCSQFQSPFPILHTVFLVWLTSSVLEMKAAGFPEMLQTIRHHIPEDCILKMKLITYTNIFIVWFLFNFSSIASKGRNSVKNGGYSIGLQLSQPICSMRFKLWFFKMYLKQGVVYIQYSKCTWLVANIRTNTLALLSGVHTLHSLDPKFVKMTVGCGIYHIKQKHMYNWTEVFTKANTRGYT